MIRTATAKDLDEIVAVHCTCFPNSFTTVMGKHLLKCYYAEFMENNRELFLVSESNENPSKIDGFCMGYYGESPDGVERFIKRNFVRFSLRVLWLLLTFNGLAWKRAASVLRRKNDVIVVNDMLRSFVRKDSAELLSICVLKDKRGTGLSSLLVDEYEQVLQEQRRRVCVLSVLADNERAIRFYEKKGFTLVKKIGSSSLVYAKTL